MKRKIIDNVRFIYYKVIKNADPFRINIKGVVIIIVENKVIFKSIFFLLKRKKDP